MGKTLLFRGDGDSKTGLGHLYRLLGLAHIYKGTYDIVFITRTSSDVSMIDEHFAIKYIPDEVEVMEEPLWLSTFFNSDDYILVADGYEFSSEFQKKVKQVGYLLIYVDDLCEEYMYADAVINHAMEVTKENYKSESYTSFYLGTGYSILRPAFYEAMKEEREIDKITTCFVCFGGSDQLDLSHKICLALLDESINLEIRLVLGSAYGHQEVYDLAQNNKKLRIYKGLKEHELCDLMKSCQLAIVSSSTVLYEVSSVGMPTIAGFYMKNQLAIYNGFLNKNTIIAGDNFSKITVGDFKDLIVSALKRRDLSDFVTKQRDVFNPSIISSFHNLMFSLCSK